MWDEISNEEIIKISSIFFLHGLFFEIVIEIFRCCL